jgi:hypothetical protein
MEKTVQLSQNPSEKNYQGNELSAQLRLGLNDTAAHEFLRVG